MRAVSIGLVVGGVLLASSAAQAQVNQIHPRVMIMLDTSGSMTQHIDSGTDSGADGSRSYTDAQMTRSVASNTSDGMYPGYETGTLTCPAAAGASYDGVNSRMYNGKQAITDVVNGSGDIDWGLMRYTGFDCPLVETFTPQTCTNSGGTACSTGTTCNGASPRRCPCTTDSQCKNNQFCVGGVCGTVDNLCDLSNYGGTNARNNNTCGNKGNLPTTYGGDQFGNANTTSCGVNNAVASAACATTQTCYFDADCNAGAANSCVPLTGSAAKACKCGGGFNCPANYTCGAGGFCVYNLECQSPGGQILVDPSAASFSDSQVLPYVDGVEDYNIGLTKSGAVASITAGGGAGNARLTGLAGMAITDVGKALQITNANSAANNGYFTIVNFVSATSVDIHNAAAVTPDTKNGTVAWNVKYPANPELRASLNTPLAGAARSATNWYNSIINSDPVKACRPYVLVQITDGFDTCEAFGSYAGNATAGPVAAAQSFVAATVPGNANKPLNKVYVIGLNLSSPTLDNIAAAGGTGSARLATSQQGIEAALADIVASSVLVEKCNGIDDNCNNLCDENFPGVAKGPTCGNPKPTPDSCDNGQLGQCLATGVFVCSADQLSQVCSTPVCTTHTGATVSSPSANTMRLSNAPGAGVVGQILFVSGSTKVANNGGFLITAVTANTVDLANSGVVVPDASVVDYAVPSTQGAATTSVAAGGNVTLTVPAGSTAGVAVGATIFILGATNAANNGQFTVSAVTNTSITYGNAAGVSGDLTIKWAVNICKGLETCNGLDDDCDGIIDNCGGSTPGSCCTSNCPACAKAPFLETCNNCDDDCDGIIDNHLVDTGLSCGNNVGDCAGGQTVCCNNASNPNGAPPTCVVDGLTDHIICKSGNPPYPTPGADVCDGTDDNCNGVANDGPPLACFTDGTSTLPPAKDGVGVCHHGLEACQTLPFCNVPAAPGPCVPGACPAGWPAGKTCPNPTPSYGACQGLVAPTTEFCDGLDNDCNNCKDDNPADTWINTECCGASGGNPLTDCDGSVAGTMCHRGHWQCFQPGGACTAGAKSCIGAVAKTPEVCNGIDDDCNGIIDDVPGVGAPCTGTGIFTGGECTAVMKCVTNGQPPQCVQVQGPVAETCNGKDDNCNGEIDDNNPPLAQNPLPGVGVACDSPMPPADKPPCKPGMTICQAGMIVCVGAVHPMPNQCNGISTDCTGNPNTNGNCPSGFQCYQGNCVAPCEAGEFPCPGGYACNQNTTACDMNGMHTGCCVPDACANLSCPPGFTCKLDAQGNASCNDPCNDVMCPPTYVCKAGACVDGSCRTQGCPDGQVCVSTGINVFMCQDDPCANVMCDSNQFCQQGQCVNSCSGPCPNGQYCNQGQCTPDPCAHTPCVEGQVCRIENGIGVCVENQCQFGCNIGQACCGGECVADQCENLHCPEDTHCKLAPDCNATCETNPASPKDQIVGAGGGGFGCAVSGQASDSSSLAWLLVVAGALLFRRRRAAEVRK